MADELVSVIIPTFNSERTLLACLSSISAQEYPQDKIEIIIVDGYSKDHTIDIAKMYNAELIQINCERSKAKNIGIKTAKGKYIFFIDSDMILTNRVIGECIAVISDDSTVGGVIIPERSIGKSYWVKVRDFERSFYSSTKVESARFFRKNLVDLVGGFDENVVFYEESTLVQKISNLKFKLDSRINSEILHDENDFSITKWMKKKYYYGITASDYSKIYSDYCQEQLSVFSRLSIFFKNRRFYSNPSLTFGVIALKFSEFIFMSLGSLSHAIKFR
jgi:glycosyltransferase involved in cell wall biosynthesis